MIKQFIAIISLIIFFACNGSTPKEVVINTKDSSIKDSVKPDSSSIPKVITPTAVINDSLDEIATIIAGMKDQSERFKATTQSAAYQSFYKTFNARWINFDSTRLAKLKEFRSTELDKLVPAQSTLFYPFSGPDILYANSFFPNAERYVLIGLEPVGSLPNLATTDSLSGYFDRLNGSLNAILKFSFFRTVSMSSDLKNKHVDGTLHVLLLFLKRNGHSICDIKPLTIDSLGQTVYKNSFAELKSTPLKTRGVEITFITTDKAVKTITYFSLNAADDGLSENKGFVTYLKTLSPCNTYLKGASYLMHKSYFSTIRSIILNQSTAVIQDDSGIALHYFSENALQWNYNLFGKYSRPIPMFSSCYQSDLDSLYKQKGSKDIGFGIGYNFRDKNSNFMVAVKK
jgi:hypothetical protein